MGGNVSVEQARQEAWIWYSFAVAVTACRYAGQRILRRSWRKLQWDDWVMGAVIVFYTIQLIYTVKLAELNDAVWNVPEPIPEDLLRLYAQYSFVCEMFFISALWGVKTCFLILYSRLTAHASPRLRIANRIAAVYTAVTYIVIFVCYFVAFCKPFIYFFEYDDSKQQCYTFGHYFVLNLVLGVTSDIFILAIPLSLVYGSATSWKRKLGFGAIFALGIFSIIATITSKVETILGHTTNNWEVWYTRESGTAILAANLLLCRPLLQKIARIWTQFAQERAEKKGENWKEGRRDVTWPTNTTGEIQKVDGQTVGTDTSETMYVKGPTVWEVRNDRTLGVLPSVESV